MLGGPGQFANQRQGILQLHFQFKKVCQRPHDLNLSSITDLGQIYYRK